MPQMKHIIDGKYGITVTGDLINMNSGEVLPTDEPLFLFRGRDKLAPDILTKYYEACLQGGCEQDQWEGVREQAEKFYQFQADHPERVKLPTA